MEVYANARPKYRGGQDVQQLQPLHRGVPRVLQPLCREAELPALALDILLFIANNPDKSTARDVCQFRGMKPGIVSFHVDRLAAAGLLERRPVPGDRRKTQLVWHRGGGGYDPARAGAAKALCRSAAHRS